MISSILILVVVLGCGIAIGMYVSSQIEDKL